MAKRTSKKVRKVKRNDTQLVGETGTVDLAAQTSPQAPVQPVSVAQPQSPATPASVGLSPVTPLWAALEEQHAFHDSPSELTSDQRRIVEETALVEHFGSVPKSPAEAMTARINDKLRRL